MIAIPIYNTLVIPGSHIYFKGDFFSDIAGSDAKVGDETVLLFARESLTEENMSEDLFFPIGALGRVSERDINGYVEIEVTSRVDVAGLTIDSENHMEIVYGPRDDIEDLDPQKEKEDLKKVKAEVIKSIGAFQWGNMVRGFISKWENFGEVATSFAHRLLISNEEKYAILKEDRVSKRTELLCAAIYEFLEMTKISNEAEEAQESENKKAYRESAIRKQMDYLQRELDDMHPENISDIRRLELRIEEAGMSKPAKEEALKVLGRMKMEGNHGSEYGMLHDYLDFLTSLAWTRAKEMDINLYEAEEILENDHYGLKKVKKRIIEQIAVMQLNKKQAGSILLFAGPPGTGKTSIGQSIARALKREYVRVSLGGVKDEAEIRGHRRTYIGAMPGRIMDGIKKSKVSNPVMVLDEIDKLSNSYNGDPASALLEVLDPRQNFAFTDHYMNVPYDLSQVLFICTANSVDTIPEPLLNRMEVIPFMGYTETEKVEIAKRHLLPKSMEDAGISKGILQVSGETIRRIISDYTAESGVRGLKRRLDSLCRMAAVKLVKGEKKTLRVTPKKLREYLDAKPIRHDNMLEKVRPGIVTGLAWTRAGGEILFIESLFTKGSGKTIVTGQLGDVMKESVQLAVSLVKSIFPDSENIFKENDLHIHIPQGAVPKDGPSAGITLTMALASLVRDKAVDTSYAMTGEVSLRGDVLPVGGLPEKLMAAVRAGIKTVFIPEDNEEDLEELAKEVREQLEIIKVKEILQVLKKLKLS